MWKHNGYTGTGNVNSLIGSLEGRTALVVGSSEGVFDDLDRAISYFQPDEPAPVLFAVNDVGMFLPHVDHWVSVHIKKFPAWRSVRKAHELNSPQIHSINYGVGINWAWVNVRPIFVLSGYFAMQLAYIMEAEQIVLCGCPGDSQRRFFDIRGRHFGYGSGDTLPDRIVLQQLAEEMMRLPDFKRRVSSMSGWSRQFFGDFHRDVRYVHEGLSA